MSGPEMKNYKSRILQKSKKGSFTPGRQKGESCRAYPWDRAMARANRSYKWDGYSDYIKRMDRKLG